MLIVYKILYKNLIAGKPLRIRFDKIDGCTWVSEGTRYWVLFGSKNIQFHLQQDWIFDWIIGVKNGITYVISNNYAKIKLDSYESLPLEKDLPFFIMY